MLGDIPAWDLEDRDLAGKELHNQEVAAALREDTGFRGSWAVVDKMDPGTALEDTEAVPHCSSRAAAVAVEDTDWREVVDTGFQEVVDTDSLAVVGTGSPVVGDTGSQAAADTDYLVVVVHKVGEAAGCAAG